MEIRPVIKQFGEPAEQLVTPEGLIQLWAEEPFLVSRTTGYITEEMGQTLSDFYHRHFPKFEAIVTIHDWADLTEYDPACRKIVQQLTNTMRSKQKEIIIHLGPATSLGQKAVRVTAETISRFKRIPIEIFSEDGPFESRVQGLLKKYRSG